MGSFHYLLQQSALGPHDSSLSRSTIIHSHLPARLQSQSIKFSVTKQAKPWAISTHAKVWQKQSGGRVFGKYQNRKHVKRLWRGQQQTSSLMKSICQHWYLLTQTVDWRSRGRMKPFSVLLFEFSCVYFFLKETKSTDLNYQLYRLNLEPLTIKKVHLTHSVLFVFNLLHLYAIMIL